MILPGNTDRVGTTPESQALVSVVVPVFNGENHLRELIESVQAQTHRNLEIIFTEGGGTDSSQGIIREYAEKDPRIQLILTQERITAAENWTKATRAASADYIKLICQDDLLTPDSIEKQLQDLTNFPHAVMAIAQRDVIDRNSKVLYAKRGLTGLKGKEIDGSRVVHTCYLQGTNVIGEPLAVLFRREPLLAAMPWTDQNPLMLDLNTYQKVAPLGTVVTRHESLGAFRVSTSSWSTRLAKLQLEHTKQWQHAYAQESHPTAAHRVRAAAGRHIQVNLRRAAYRILKARGTM